MKKPRQKSTLTTRDKYLQRKFFISEDEYNEGLKAQGGVCRNCGKPPGTKSLHVDHDHGIERWKIDVKKIPVANPNKEKVYTYWAWPRGYLPNENEIGTSRLAFIEKGTTRAEAKAKVKARLMRLSVRGILCWRCNKVLQILNNDPTLARNAGNYLDNYYEYLNGTLPEHPNFRGLNNGN